RSTTSTRSCARRAGRPTTDGRARSHRRRRRSLDLVTAAWDTEQLPEGDEKVAAVQGMFDAIAPRYDRLNRIISLRLDVGWRRRTVHDLALPPGSRVLDLASGTGDLCIDLVKAGLRPISMDLSFGMLCADRSGAPRVQTDILRLPVPDGC